VAYWLSNDMEIIDLRWPWRSVCAIGIKRCKIKPRLLLIINRIRHTPFQMKWKSSTLDDLEDHWQPVQLAILATAGLFCYIHHRLNICLANLKMSGKMTVAIEMPQNWLWVREMSGDCQQIKTWLFILLLISYSGNIDV